MSGDSVARLIYLSLLLAALAGWGLVEYRQRRGQTLRVLLAWGLIFLGVAAGYGLWQDLRGDLLPVQQVEGARIVVPRAPDGHYYLQLAVNGTAVTFLADTGASQIVLSPADAARLGLEPAALAYLSAAETANGLVRTARVVLPEVTLGPFHDKEVTAFVNEAAMQGSLLGMSYLGRFAISLENDRMILRR